MISVLKKRVAKSQCEVFDEELSRFTSTIMKALIGQLKPIMARLITVVDRFL